MACRIDILSIGTLSRNRIWKETTAVRTPHATTSLIRAGGRVILVDPGLPAPVQVARLFERTGLRPDAVDTVFLTTFRPAHREGLAAFEHATWLIHDAERDAVAEHLGDLRDRGDDEIRSTVSRELDLLERFQSPEDKLADQVDLFPLPGYTPGTCGLLITEPTTTTLVAGDAVPTRDHLLAGQVLADPFNNAQAQESLREAYEIADVIVPGHDNLFQNPRHYGV